VDGSEPLREAVKRLPTVLEALKDGLSPVRAVA